MICFSSFQKYLSFPIYTLKCSQNMCLKEDSLTVRRFLRRKGVRRFLSFLYPRLEVWDKQGIINLSLHKPSKKCSQSNISHRQKLFWNEVTRVQSFNSIKFRYNQIQTNIPLMAPMYCQIMRIVCINFSKYKVLKNI